MGSGSCFSFDADPDTTFHSDANPVPDPTFQFDMDALSDPTIRFSTNLDHPILQNYPLRLPHFDADPDPDPAFHFDTDTDQNLAYQNELFSPHVKQRLWLLNLNNSMVKT